VTTADNPTVANNGKVAALPAGTPKAQYNYVYGLLMKRDLPKAEAALKAFLANHPKHELADNATFWLGETHYTRKNYQEAIRVYYDAYKKYPKGNKAPAVLLKLGMSLANIGEKNRPARPMMNWPILIPGPAEGFYHLPLGRGNRSAVETKYIYGEGSQFRVSPFWPRER